MKRMVDEKEVVKDIEAVEGGIKVIQLDGTNKTVEVGGSSTVDWSDIQNKPNFATVATTGDYDDLTDKPDLSIYAESSSLATVATTGDYDDLLNKPTIPDAVEGNPTVPSGTTPTDLTGLKIGNDYFGISAGGSLNTLDKSENYYLWTLAKNSFTEDEAAGIFEHPENYEILARQDSNLPGSSSYRLVQLRFNQKWISNNTMYIMFTSEFIWDPSISDDYDKTCIFNFTENKVDAIGAGKWFYALFTYQLSGDTYTSWDFSHYYYNYNKMFSFKTPDVITGRNQNELSPQDLKLINDCAFDCYGSMVLRTNDQINYGDKQYINGYNRLLGGFAMTRKISQYASSSAGLYYVRFTWNTTENKWKQADTHTKNPIDEELYLPTTWAFNNNIAKLDTSYSQIDWKGVSYYAATYQTNKFTISNYKHDYLGRVSFTITLSSGEVFNLSRNISSSVSWQVDTTETQDSNPLIIQKLIFTGTNSDFWNILYKQLDASLIDFTQVPTSDPQVAGQLWNDNGTLKVSSGI